MDPLGDADHLDRIGQESNRRPIAHEAMAVAEPLVGNGQACVLVRQSGIEPASHGYRPRSLPLRYERMKMVRLAGDDPAPIACHASALPLSWRRMVRAENYDISTFGL
jgi:hypothetical protein